MFITLGSWLWPFRTNKVYRFKYVKSIDARQLTSFKRFFTENHSFYHISHLDFYDTLPGKCIFIFRFFFIVFIFCIEISVMRCHSYIFIILFAYWVQYMWIVWFHQIQACHCFLWQRVGKKLPLMNRYKSLRFFSHLSWQHHAFCSSYCPYVIIMLCVFFWCMCLLRFSRLNFFFCSTAAATVLDAVATFYFFIPATYDPRANRRKNRVGLFKHMEIHWTRENGKKRVSPIAYELSLYHKLQRILISSSRTQQNGHILLLFLFFLSEWHTWLGREWERERGRRYYTPNVQKIILWVPKIYKSKTCFMFMLIDSLFRIKVCWMNFDTMQQQIHPIRTNNSYNTHQSYEMCFLYEVSL